MNGIVAIGKPERQVLKASHCGNKQQWGSHAMIILLLLVRATYIWVLFFALIPFVVNHTFNAMPTERLQQYLLGQEKRMDCAHGSGGCDAVSQYWNKLACSFVWNVESCLVILGSLKNFIGDHFVKVATCAYEVFNAFDNLGRHLITEKLHGSCYSR